MATSGHKGPCYLDDCPRPGKIKVECELCAAKGKEFSYLCCGPHSFEARDKMKKHCMLKHAGVLPSWIAAALRGDDMT